VVNNRAMDLDHAACYRATTEVGLMRAMAGPGGRRPSPAELAAHAQRWRPWRAYAAVHLWASGRHAAASWREVAQETGNDQQAA